MATMTTPFARQVPGGFVNTPQTIRTSLTAQRPPAFRLPSNPTLQNAAQAPRDAQPEPGLATSSSQPAPTARTISPMQRAANSINQSLALEQRFPVLDDYVFSGTSSDYDMPEDTAWMPFERAKNFDIPDRIFEQLNVAQVATRLGLFAQLHHAWVAIDNSLYLWDYTHPNPELIGFDELRESIQVVHLAKPKPDVFLSNVTHVLLIATMSEVVILGLGATKSPEGVTSVSLYQTGLRVPLKGLTPACFASSAVTGRIFLGFSDVNDVYEITYQKEERWFFSKCGKINHTSPYILSAVAATTGIHKMPIMGPPSTPEYTNMMEVDDSREMLYVLSSRSTIRVYRMKSPASLILVVNKSWNDTLRNLAHVVQYSNTLSPRLMISSISPISRMQSNRIHLVATTVGGVRMYFTIVSSGAYLAEESTSSMQIHHVRPPPPNSTPGSTNPAHGGALASDALIQTVKAKRYPPGFHFFVVSSGGPNDKLFVSCPDSGRLARYSETGGAIKFLEASQYVQMNGNIQDIDLTQPEFAATKAPAGFGNEMAVQFDQSPTEVAILTNQGVHLFRRQRLVDTFASSLRGLLTDEDFENCIKKFIRIFGRVETCACAVAVACGHSVVADNEVKNYARRAFTEHGGKPDLQEVLDAGQAQLDNVRPSPRAQALTLYVSRIIRSAWTAKVITATQTPAGGIVTKPTVTMAKLNDISRSLMDLKSFLQANKPYIAGLSGPEEMNRVTSVAEQVALQGEHRILDALFKAISNTIEGIAFLAELFDQPVDEIVLSLQDDVRDRFKSLTYAELFLSDDGKIVAKEVIKAIVNRSIAAGSNVETVAESLRRRCGSFCSADDVVIFKAQELLQKAINSGAETATGRSLLNESLKLFQQVTGSLSNQYLETAVLQYVNMQFFAGAIQLCLSAAQQRDGANRALAWIKDGSPEPDSRKSMYDQRIGCYNQIWNVIEAVDAASTQTGTTEQRAINVARRREEAYGVINSSEDEVFQNCLYDWYLQRNWSQRLLELTSPFVRTYLQRKSENEKDAADLLWRYYTHHHEYFEAAKVQLQLSKSFFQIDLPSRMEYLSRAKANASARRPGFGSLVLSRQEPIMSDITDQLDCAGVQLDILKRLENDARLHSSNRDNVLKSLNDRILSLDDLYNEFALSAGYHDLCLVIFNLSDYRNSTDIAATWQNFIQATHAEAESMPDTEPHVLLQERVRSLGKRLNCSEITFNTQTVLTLLLEYCFQTITAQQPFNTRGSREWPVDLMLDLSVPPETVLNALEHLLFNDGADWSNSRRRIVAALVVHACQRWFVESASGGGVPFGSLDNASTALEALRAVADSDLCAGRDKDALRDALEATERVF